MAKHFRFVRWLKSRGCSLRKTCLVLYAKDYRGLHTTVDIAEHEEILSIPLSLTISAANLEKESDLGRQLVGAKMFDEKWRRFLFPLVYILEELRNPDSQHKSWLEVFPQEATAHPAFFSQKEREWLQGSSILEQAEIEIRKIQGFYNDLVKMDNTFHDRHTFEEFAKWYFILGSRFFGVSAPELGRVTLLVPYADMVNSTNVRERNATWELDSAAARFRVRALAPIKANEPVPLQLSIRIDRVYVRTQVKLRVSHPLRHDAAEPGV